MSQARTTNEGVDSPPASDTRQTPAVGSGRRRTEDGRDDDELFEMLANQRRRFALHYLRQRPDERVSLSTLSEHVAGWEHGVDAESLEYAERKNVRNSLHQFHLPKLADAGIVAYDEGETEVVLLDAAGADAYHAVTDGDDRTWAPYGVAASAGGLGVHALWLLDPGANPPVTWTALLVAAFALAAVALVTDRDDRPRTRTPPECDADA